MTPAADPRPQTSARVEIPLLFALIVTLSTFTFLVFCDRD